MAAFPTPHVPVKTHKTTVVEGADLPPDGAELLALMRRMWVAHQQSLPPLGGTAAHLHRLASNPKASMDDALAVVERDPALAAAVLRLANSAALRAVQPVSDLRRALMRVGVGGVRDMAFAKAMGTFCHGGVLGDRLAASYRHAFMVANGTQWGCRAVGLEAGLGFLAGLLHDVGELGLLMCLAQSGEARRWLEWPDALRNTLLELHGEVGVTVVKAWDLPPLLAEVTLHHHRPAHALIQMPLTAMVAAMNVAAHLDLTGKPLEDALGALPDLFAVGIDPRHLGELAKVLSQAAQDPLVNSLRA